MLIFLKLFDKSEKGCYTIYSNNFLFKYLILILPKLNINLGGENEKTLLIIT
jgi:hypothetical protein